MPPWLVHWMLAYSNQYSKAPINPVWSGVYCLTGKEQEALHTILTSLRLPSLNDLIQHTKLQTIVKKIQWLFLHNMLSWNKTKHGLDHSVHREIRWFLSFGLADINYYYYLLVQLILQILTDPITSMRQIQPLTPKHRNTQAYPGVWISYLEQFPMLQTSAELLFN